MIIFHYLYCAIYNRFIDHYVDLNESCCVCLVLLLSPAFYLYCSDCLCGRWLLNYRLSYYCSRMLISLLFHFATGQHLLHVLRAEMFQIIDMCFMSKMKHLVNLEIKYLLLGSLFSG